MDLLIIFEPQNLLYTVMVFGSRVVDVSLGTLRTIAIVNGRTTMAFWLGFFESAIWLAVVSTIVQSVAAQPLLGVIYALGFATGNLVGIKIERLVAIGNMVMRVISRENSQEIISQLRDDGFAVTVFTGEGREGTVLEMYVVCRRRDFKRLLKQIKALDPHAFYVTERTGDVSKLYRPIMQPATGWRAIMKKK